MSHGILRSPFLFILLGQIGVIGVLAPVKLDLHNQIRCLLDRYRYALLRQCGLLLFQRSRSLSDLTGIGIARI